MAPPTFFGLPVCYCDVLSDPQWPLSAQLEDTVSGKEAGNRGFEKYWRFRRVDSRTCWPRSSRLYPTAQMNVPSSAMALSPVEPSVDNNRQQH